MAKIDLKPLPPEEAIDAFRRKGYALTFDWRDMPPQEHSRAFTVAKVMSMDILADIRVAVDDAIAKGETLADFKKRLTPVLQEKGWWGRQEMADPLTGEIRDVQLGSPRRLQIIYDTNLRMAHAAGRWERIERVADRRPWLRYVAILDDRTRQQHAAWHNTVLRWDDPFWSQHAPPNGWRCRCSVQQLSDRDVDRRGLTRSQAPDVPVRTLRNKRTGEVMRVPAGIDPGFHYNVGRANLAHMRNVATEALDAAAIGGNGDVARATISSMVGSSSFASYLRSPAAGAGPALAGGHPVAAGAGRLGAERPTLTLPERTVTRQRAAEDLPAPEDWLRVQRLVDEGDVAGDGDVRRVTLDASPLVLEVERGEDGRMSVRSLRRVAP